MRVERDGISVRAWPGSHAVLFGFDATEEARRGLLGFALGVRRADGAVAWRRGFKFFAETVPNPAPGERRPTTEHPIQDFQWGDYAATPGTRTPYVVQAVYGTPAALRHGAEIDVPVSTADPGADHAVFHNRGAAASQAWADRFDNARITPEEADDPGNAKTRWLSRGLLEACLAFIAEARDARFELRVAAYEFTYGPVARALREAAGRGAQVRLVYDIGDRRRDGTIAPNHTSGANAATIAAAGLDAAQGVALHGRSRYSAITHNKFIVLLEGGHPVAVWTGSTNFTPSGFLGQANNAHRIRDQGLAAAFAAYWELLAGDPDTRKLKAALARLTPDPAQPLPENTLVPVFSPRSRGMMDWYAAALGAAKGSVFFTSAFGVDPGLAAVFARPGEHLRLILSERAETRPAIRALLTADRDTRLATGARLNAEALAAGLPGGGLEQWFRAEELARDPNKGHIFYIHQKLMLLDATGASPAVFTGSANFSKNSVEANDENMVLMRGPRFAGVATVEVAEFQRLWNHLYFRTVALRRAKARTETEARQIAMLDPTDAWTAPHFRPGTYADRTRRLFA
jgi:phosphatidylserine/phosphatidylglycerophosphate/cardiolipin synthase-like enzyme